MAKFFSRGPKLKVSAETNKQMDVVLEEMRKLTDLSNIGWHLIADRCYKREMSLSALGGAAATGTIIGLTAIAKKVYKNRKQLKKELNK